jgi:adenylate cyclase class IV
MIEVEIKIQLTEEQKQKLLDGAIFVSTETIYDEYYDSADYKLTTKGFWLRTRDGKFMLKTPATQGNVFNIEKNLPFHEILDAQLVSKALELPLDKPLSQTVEAAGYKPFYKLKTTRQKYKKDDIIIDIDHADYGDMTYNLCELEIMVADQGQVQPALDKLYEFATQHGLSTKRAEGKLFYYIKRTNPEHYKAITTSDKSKA